MGEKLQGMIPIYDASEVWNDPMAATMVHEVALMGAEDAAEAKGLEVDPDTLKETDRFDFGVDRSDPENPQVRDLRYYPHLEREGVMVWFEAYTKDKSDG